MWVVLWPRPLMVREPGSVYLPGRVPRPQDLTSGNPSPCCSTSLQTLPSSLLQGPSLSPNPHPATCSHTHSFPLGKLGACLVCVWQPCSQV